MEKKQLENEEIKKGIIRRYKKDDMSDDDALQSGAIAAYVPIQEEQDESDEVTFGYYFLNSCEFNAPGDISPITDKAHKFR